MSNTPSSTKSIMRRPAPDDEISVRYVIPAGMLSSTKVGHTITTCLNGVITVPKSVAISHHKRANADVVVLEAKVRRDVAEVIGSLVAEVVRLTRELEEKGVRNLS
jgi:hypothetical protein